MTSLVLTRLRELRLPRLSPAIRISAGLSVLIVSYVLLIDIVVGVVPDQEAELASAHKRTGESLAVFAAQLLQAGDQKALSSGLGNVVARHPDVLTAAVRRDDGTLAISIGDHARRWIAPPPGESTVDFGRVPLNVDGRHWGDFEISFKPMYESAVQRWLADPLVRLIGTLGIGCFLLFALYLRQVLSYLDPSTVIPDRVRAAFDAFGEGVMVVDANFRIMLVNKALLKWLEEDFAAIQGRPAHELRPLRHLYSGNPSDFPWAQAMLLKRQLMADVMELVTTTHGVRKTTVNCAPVLDGQNGVRGCIVTFDDVTPLEQANQALRVAMSDLETSRAQVEKQNEELRKLAERDPLTGCLNRRAFFEGVDKLFPNAREKGEPLYCIMVDIDHFKSFNDLHGHAVGDQVLQSVSRLLWIGLRDSDLLCRYGGEEFCIMVPAVTMEQAEAIAERLRREIEALAGAGVRSVAEIAVTSSFGIAVLTPDITEPAKLIERADEALYEAKRSGRNRVVTWRPPETEVGPTTQ